MCVFFCTSRSTNVAYSALQSKSCRRSSYTSTMNNSSSLLLWKSCQQFAESNLTALLIKVSFALRLKSLVIMRIIPTRRAGTSAHLRTSESSRFLPVHELPYHPWKLGMPQPTHPPQRLSVLHSYAGYGVLPATVSRTQVLLVDLFVFLFSGEVFATGLVKSS